MDEQGHHRVGDLLDERRFTDGLMEAVAPGWGADRVPNESAKL